LICPNESVVTLDGIRSPWLRRYAAGGRCGMGCPDAQGSRLDRFAQPLLLLGIQVILAVEQLHGLGLEESYRGKGALSVTICHGCLSPRAQGSLQAALENAAASGSC
jgi:hypothetical protein